MSEPRRTSLAGSARGSATTKAVAALQAPEIAESSGLVASRMNQGILWLHNDSGDSARLVRFSGDGAERQLISLGEPGDVRTYTPPPIEAIDWEDVAIGPGPLTMTDYLYVGDIGDNASMRNEIWVHRLVESSRLPNRAPSVPGYARADRIVLRYPEHKFLFANPQNLESSGDDPDHLQQNYIMGFVFTDEQGDTSLSTTDDWYEDFNDVFDTLEPKDSVSVEDMQIDNRHFVVNEGDE